MKVRNLSNGRVGTVMNGYAQENGRWTEYEVWTDRGIEVWSVDAIQFIETEVP